MITWEGVGHELPRQLISEQLERMDCQGWTRTYVQPEPAASGLGTTTMIMLATDQYCRLPNPVPSVSGSRQPIR
jgi:hypothetical protein